MPDPDPSPPVRLADPGDLAAALPHLLGFHPRESLVVVGLRGPAGLRVGLTARVDLPAPEHRPLVLSGVVRSLLTDRPRAVLLAVVSDDPGSTELPHRELVHEGVLTFTAAGVPVREALLVGRGRWWSYDCAGPCCGPAAGTPLPAGTSPLAVASAVAGRVTEADRAALEQRIAPGDPAATAAMAVACDRVGEELAVRTARLGWHAVAEEAESAVRAAVDAAAPGRVWALTDRQVARLAWAVRDVDVRDRALQLSLGADAAAAEAVWTELTRRVPAPLDAAPATLLAVSAWLRGDGALANVALDRALAGEPSYRLARLLRTGLDACLPPAEVRRLVEAAGDGAR